MAADAFRLEGQVALVTGTASGIGAAIATALAGAGADVVCHSHREDAGSTVERCLQQNRRSFAIQADLADRSTHERLISESVERFGRLDILVNNAGLIRRAPAVDYSDDDWDLLLAVNLSAVFRLSRAAAKHMLVRGSGRIVNIASLLSFQGGILVPAYAASKGGVAQLTKALANEWAARGIGVNAIAPGYIATANTAALRADPDRSRQILERIPAGRWGDPSDIAGATVFLCGEASRYVNGHVLAVDGGWLGR